MRLNTLQIVTDARTDVGVRRDGGGALEFAILLRQFVGGGDVTARQTRLEKPLGGQLMRGVAVTVQKQNGHRFDRLGLKRLGDSLKLIFGRLSKHLTGCGDPLIDFKAKRALHQRNVLPEKQVVGLWPVDPADFINVAKSAGGHERRARAASLEQRVDPNGGAMQKQVSLIETRTRPGQARADSLDDPRRRGERLAEQQPAAGFVEHRDVGKGAAHIGGDP